MEPSVMGLTGNSRAVDALPPQLTPAHVHTHAHGGHHRAATFTGGIGEQGKIFTCELPPRRPIVINNRHDPARAKATGGALWTIVCGTPPQKNSSHHGADVSGHRTASSLALCPPSRTGWRHPACA